MIENRYTWRLELSGYGELTPSDRDLIELMIAKLKTQRCVNIAILQEHSNMSSDTDER